MSKHSSDRFLRNLSTIEECDASIEQRLRSSAERIVASRQLCVAPAEIVAEHRRRERLFRAKRNAAVGVAAGACVAFAAIFWGSGFGEENRHVSSDKHATALLDAMDSPQSADAGRADSSSTVLETQDSHFVGIPLLVAIGEWEGRPVVTPALYVPPHARRLDHASLTPAERMAVERLLGLTRHGSQDTTL